MFIWACNCNILLERCVDFVWLCGFGWRQRDTKYLSGWPSLYYHPQAINIRGFFWQVFLWRDTSISFNWFALGNTAKACWLLVQVRPRLEWGRKLRHLVTKSYPHSATRWNPLAPSHSRTHLRRVKPWLSEWRVNPSWEHLQFPSSRLEQLSSGRQRLVNLAPSHKGTLTVPQTESWAQSLGNPSPSRDRWWYLDNLTTGSRMWTDAFVGSQKTPEIPGPRYHSGTCRHRRVAGDV